MHKYCFLSVMDVIAGAILPEITLFIPVSNITLIISSEATWNLQLGSPFLTLSWAEVVSVFLFPSRPALGILSSNTLVRISSTDTSICTIEKYGLADDYCILYICIKLVSLQLHASVVD